MQPIKPMNSPERSRGIALVTSLIFLTVATLLALSAMRGVGLQERMASNLREKSRALDAANTALRDREFTIFEWEEPPQATAAGEGGVWLLGAPLDGVNTNGLGFAADAVWDDALVYDEPFDNGTNGLVAPPESFVEQACFETVYNGVSAVDAARATNPVVEQFRVTSRGQGGNANAVAVVQSTFAAIFYETDVVLTQTERCFE